MVLNIRRAATESEVAALTTRIGGTSNMPGEAGVELERRWAADEAAFARAFDGRPLTADQEVALFFQRQQERRALASLEQLRGWTFWGPFWAIIVSGGVGALLYLAATSLFVASGR